MVLDDLISALIAIRDAKPTNGVREVIFQEEGNFGCFHLSSLSNDEDITIYGVAFTAQELYGNEV